MLIRWTRVAWRCPVHQSITNLHTLRGYFGDITSADASSKLRPFQATGGTIDGVVEIEAGLST